MGEIVPTVVAEDARFEGVLTFRGAARVEGALRGEVVGEGRLVVGPRARVHATVEVDELVLAGELEGEVTARARTEILAGARLAGTLSTARLAMADGASLDGRCQAGRAPGGTAPEAAAAAADAPARAAQTPEAPPGTP